MSLKQFIETKRPNLSASSVTTYNSVLKNLYKRVFGDEQIDIKKFNNTEPIVNFIKDEPPNKRKSILSALVVVTDNDKYRKMMLEDINKYNDYINTQQKSEVQSQNWISKTEVETIFDNLEKEAKQIYKKQGLKMRDLQIIQDYVIVALLGGIFIPPRRLLDFTEFKIKDINKEKNNFYHRGKFHFNHYKTAKTYGEQQVNVPEALKKIINKWIKINPTNWLLFDSNSSKLNAVKLNQRLNKIFNGKVSVNNLRHTYLTNKFGDTIEKNKQIEKTMESMGSSKGMLTTYVKEE
jgi:hypothetical protein